MTPREKYKQLFDKLRSDGYEREFYDNKPTSYSLEVFVNRYTSSRMIVMWWYYTAEFELYQQTDKG